jgi:sirohydrochlorin cobaltochelatase
MNRYAVIAIAHMASTPNRPIIGRMPGTGLILFAHGARDARWREPFERLAAKVQAVRPEIAVCLAFLEIMQPDLAAAANALIARGCVEIRVVPVFLGQGGHVREDLPAVVEDVRRRHPDLRIDLREAIGENDAVLDQIAAVSVAGL